jgi:hypothetical protein
MDTLDLAAPLEALSIPNVIAGRDNKLFNTTITAVANLATTNQGFAIQRHISIGRALDAMDWFDILNVPVEVFNKLARSRSIYMSGILLEAVFSR